MTCRIDGKLSPDLFFYVFLLLYSEITHPTPFNVYMPKELLLSIFHWHNIHTFTRRDSA